MIITKEKYKDTYIVYIDEHRMDVGAWRALKQDYDNPNIPLSTVSARMTSLRERKPIVRYV